MRTKQFPYFLNNSSLLLCFLFFTGFLKAQVSYVEYPSLIHMGTSATMNQSYSIDPNEDGIIDLKFLISIDTSVIPGLLTMELVTYNGTEILAKHFPAPDPISGLSYALHTANPYLGPIPNPVDFTYFSGENLPTVIQNEFGFDCLWTESGADKKGAILVINEVGAITYGLSASGCWDICHFRIPNDENTGFYYGYVKYTGAATNLLTIYGHAFNSTINQDTPYDSTLCNVNDVLSNDNCENFTVSMITNEGVDCNSSAEVVVAGGSSPYSYSWSHDSILNNNVASNLCQGNYTCTVTDSQGCVFPVSESIEPSNLGVNEISNSLDFISVINPVEKELKISFNDLFDGTLYILDMNGKLIFTKSIQAKNYTLDASFLTDGIYVVKLVDLFDSKSIKIIKN